MKWKDFIKFQKIICQLNLGLLYFAERNKMKQIFKGSYNRLEYVSL